MSIRFASLIAGMFLAACLLTASVFGHDHKVMNGTWSLIPEKCDFGSQPPIEHGTVTIDERQGNITVSRNFSYEGDNQLVFYRDSTDGANNAKIHSAEGVTSRTGWDHDQLRVTTRRNGETTVETYSLNADGTMTVNVTRPGGQPILLVFERR